VRERELVCLRLRLWLVDGGGGCVCWCVCDLFVNERVRHDITELFYDVVLSSFVVVWLVTRSNVGLAAHSSWSSCTSLDSAFNFGYLLGDACAEPLPPSDTLPLALPPSPLKLWLNVDEPCCRAGCTLVLNVSIICLVKSWIVLMVRRMGHLVGSVVVDDVEPDGMDESLPGVFWPKARPRQTATNKPNKISFEFILASERYRLDALMCAVR
jgi:hypothetical protein